jgi:hypothetical protein
VAQPRVPDCDLDRRTHGVPAVLGALQSRRSASQVATMRAAILAGLLFAAPALVLLTVFA